MEKSQQENKMGVMPVNQLIITMALPIIISMLVQALYNIVDSYFVAKLGEDALSAVSQAFPMQTIMISVGTGTGVGMNAMLSKSLGEGDRDTARRAAGNGMFLALCSIVAFMLVGVFGVRPFFAVQDAKYPQIMEYGVAYLQVCLLCCQGIFLELTSERILQATGHTMASMAAQLSGAAVNIALDPCFIFGLGPFPELGVTGAAVATVLGQMIGAAVGIAANAKVNREFTLSLSDCLRPHGATIRRIYSVGVPSIIMASIGSVTTFCMNLIVGGFTSTANAVLGIYFKLQSFFFMPVFGLNNALVPIIAFNFGARRRKRMTATIRLGAVYAFAILTVGCVIFHVATVPLLSLFNANQNMLDIGIPALRIISLSFPLAAIGITFISVFQALGKGMYAMTISLVRQLVVLLPVAWLLARTGVLNAVWWSYPIAEVAALVCAAYYMLRINRKIISQIPD